MTNVSADTGFEPVAALFGTSVERPGSMPFLDGLRGVAVLIMFTRHFWSLSGRPNYEIPLGLGLGSVSSTPELVRLEESGT